MAQATIQITQGAIVGGSGQSIIGFDTTTDVTLTDDGGAGATSYQWEVVSYPAPLVSPPTINDDTDQVATITDALLDGVYVIRLTRNDPVDGVTTDVRFFAVADEDGLSLPSWGMNRNMSNVGGSVAAQLAGWFGSEAASTNVFLDAYLRDLKAKVKLVLPEAPTDNSKLTFAYNGGSVFAAGISIIDPTGAQNGLVLSRIESTEGLVFQAGDITGAAGSSVTIQAGSVLAGDFNGGDVVISSGAGNGAGVEGSVTLNVASAEMVKCSAVGIGLYGADPVPQADDPGEIVDSTGGSTAGPLEDVGATFNQTTLNNNLALLADRFNKIRAILSEGEGGMGVCK